GAEPQGIDSRTQRLSSLSEQRGQLDSSPRRETGSQNLSVKGMDEFDHGSRRAVAAVDRDAGALQTVERWAISRFEDQADVAASRVGEQFCHSPLGVVEPTQPGLHEIGDPLSRRQLTSQRPVAVYEFEESEIPRRKDQLPDLQWTTSRSFPDRVEQMRVRRATEQGLGQFRRKLPLERVEIQ